MAKRKGNTKTNAIRIVEQHNIPYTVIVYDTDDGLVDGVSVAHKTNQDIDIVYKTLVTRANDRTIQVFVIPVAAELQLKKAAQIAGVKKLDLLPLQDLTKETGYIRGGCSPVGMKKLYPTFLDSRAEQQTSIIVSAGKPGLQMKVSPEDLLHLTEANYASLCIDA